MANNSRDRIFCVSQCLIAITSRISGLDSSVSKCIRCWTPGGDERHRSCQSKVWERYVTPCIRLLQMLDYGCLSKQSQKRHHLLELERWDLTRLPGELAVSSRNSAPSYKPKQTITKAHEHAPAQRVVISISAAVDTAFAQNQTSGRSSCNIVTHLANTFENQSKL